MQEQIRVKTFGRFSLEYNGQLLQMEKGMATKADHLLQYLVCHWQEKFTKEELVSLLYEEGEVSDPINNLKVTGQVSVRGAVWTARTEDDRVIPAGATIEVLRIEGVKLIVAPLPAAARQD